LIYISCVSLTQEVALTVFGTVDSLSHPDFFGKSISDLDPLTQDREGEYERRMEKYGESWRDEFLRALKDGSFPADDPFHPGCPAHIMLVIPEQAKPLSLLPEEVARQIKLEQKQLGGQMLVIWVKSSDDEEEHWPIRVDDAMRNVMGMLDRQFRD